MRICPILCTLCAFSLASCTPSSRPEANRGEGAPQATSPNTTNDTAPIVDAGTPSASPATDQATTERPANGPDDAELRLDKLVLTAPEGWQRKQPSSTFLLAEFALPKAEGDDADGRLTVSAAGGTVEANVDRWRAQFGGSPEPAKVETKDVDGLKITLVEFGGEFNDQRGGPGSPGTKRPAYRMLAAIIPVDGELHFVKATGPQATMAAHTEKFHKFIDSAKKK